MLGLLVPSHDESQTTWAERLPADGHVALVRDAERPERRTGHNLYFDDVLLGAEGAAWSAGYAFMVAVGAANRPVDLLDLAGRLDGLIVAAHPHERRPDRASAPPPADRADRRRRGVALPTV